MWNNDDNNECEEHTGGKNRVKIIIKVILDDINTISMTQHICAQTSCKDTRVTFAWICSRFFFFLRKQTHRRLSLSKKIVLFTQVRRCLNSETSNSNLISRFFIFFSYVFSFRRLSTRSRVLTWRVNCNDRKLAIYGWVWSTCDSI